MKSSGDPEEAIKIKMAGEEAYLLPQKALYLPGCKTLVVADVHIGKGASFRARKFFAPDGITAHDLARLSDLLHKYSAERLIVLGDLVHGQDGLTKDEVQLFDSFRLNHPAVPIVLIMGNHDHRARLPRSWKLDRIKGAMYEGPYAFCHEYEEHRNNERDKKSSGAYALSGHIHPSVVLRGPGRQSERLPCFWMRRRYAVLPSFGVFTGSYSVRPSQTDKVFVVAKGSVIAVGG